MSDLVERVAREMCEEIGVNVDAWVYWTDEARAAIRVVVEECARVAETNADNDLEWAARYPDEYEKMIQRAHRAKTIASAIRALLEDGK